MQLPSDIKQAKNWRVILICNPYLNEKCFGCGILIQWNGIYENNNSNNYNNHNDNDYYIHRKICLEKTCM